MWLRVCKAALGNAVLEREAPVKIAPLAIATVVLGLVACANATEDSGTTAADVSADACTKPALAAAEAEYGNDPRGEKVKALTPGKKYFVTVGIDDAEDGPHDYYVEFPNGCSSKPSVSDVPSYPHPLRDDAHTAYGTLLGDNDNAFPSSAAVASSTLPSAAKKQFNTWKSNGTSVCASVDAYKVTVAGQPTFAVACTQDNSGSVRSYNLSFAIWDKTGGDIDQATVFGKTSGVGDKGISWQNETFEETPH